MRRSSASRRLVGSACRAFGDLCFRLRYGFWPDGVPSLLGIEDLSHIPESRRRRYVRGLCAWLGHSARGGVSAPTPFEDLPVQVREFAAAGQFKPRLHLAPEAIQLLSNRYGGQGTVTAVEVRGDVLVVTFQTVLASGACREGQGRRAFASPGARRLALIEATEMAQRVSLYRALGVRLSVQLDPVPRDEAVAGRAGNPGPAVDTQPQMGPA